jgi:hypothetical protein
MYHPLPPPPPGNNTSGLPPTDPDGTTSPAQAQTGLGLDKKSAEEPLLSGAKTSAPKSAIDDSESEETSITEIPLDGSKSSTETQGNSNAAIPPLDDNGGGKQPQGDISAPILPIDGNNVFVPQPQDGSRVAEQPLDGSRVAEQPLDGSRVAEQPLDGSRVAEQPLDGSRVASQSQDGNRVLGQPGKILFLVSITLACKFFCLTHKK